MPLMPLFVKVSEWQQTLSNVTMKLPSYGITSQNVDIFTNEKYIKAHYGQHIFEIFLWGSVDVSKSKCIVTEKEIIFQLNKLIEEQWEMLEAEIDKITKKELRKQIIEENQKLFKKQDELKITKNAEFKRTAVREQIIIDSERHKWINNVKQTEKEKALREIKLWEENKFAKQLEVTNISNSVNKKPLKNDFKKSNDSSKHKSSNKYIIQEKYYDETKILPAVPLPRKSRTLNIKFTNREFPTPTRESMAKEEEEWLASQATARRSSGFIKEDLRPEERNPQWLKTKGDQFFSAKNYLGAISAYTEGIIINQDYVDLYVNRSAAHLEMGNLQKTIEDCSKALEIMVPAAPSNLDMRAKCFARRGEALCKLGLKTQGISEIDTALKLANGKQQLQQDIEKFKDKFSECQENID